MTDHSPLPWFFGHDQDGRAELRDAEGVLIAISEIEYPDLNFEFIIKAVNAHVNDALERLDSPLARSAEPTP